MDKLDPIEALAYAAKALETMAEQRTRAIALRRSLLEAAYELRLETIKLRCERDIENARS